MKPLIVGIVDAILFISLWSVVIFVSAVHTSSAINFILIFLLPCAFVVLWRGQKLAACFYSNTATPLMFATDGSKWGFNCGFVIMAFSICSQVFAAGGHLDGANLFSSATGQYILVIALPVCIIAAIGGGIHGLLFFYLNRWLVTANKSKQKDA